MVASQVRFRGRVLIGMAALLGCGAERGETAAANGLQQRNAPNPAGPVADEPAADEPAADEPAAAPSAPALPSAAPTPASTEAGPTPVAPLASSEPAPAEPLPAAPPGTETSNEPAPSGPEPDVATRLLCTGDDPIACHLGGAPGNYAVSVVLGGDEAATTLVQAEARRVLLGATQTAAGASRRVSFVVNVRQPEGEPIQNVPAGTPGLDLYFRGANGQAPAVRALGVEVAREPLVIYVAGDSTVADQTDVEYGGWGQQLPQFFDAPVVIANYADSGESSGSFLGARPLFGAIEAQLKADDWVLIQFGHNDKQVTAAQFHDNLTALVTRVKARSALPVLFSPVARAQFEGAAVAPQHINGTGANLPQIVRQVSEEQAVPFFDLTARTSQWLAELGPEGWQAFHALGSDVTHTNDAGAAIEAGFVRDFIAGSELAELRSRLR